MWEKGVQEYRFDFSAEQVNNEIEAIEGFIPEDEAQILVYRFLRANIGFASELLLGVKLFPFQHILIKSMMLGDFSMFVLSRGMSKTFSAAIYVMLQLLFKQGVKVGVLSSGFRQAKMIMGKAYDALKIPAAKIVRPLFGNGKTIIQKGTDQWTLTCGASEAIALPLADGSRLRGFRFQILLLDEFLNISKNIFQEVILPFIGVVDNPTVRADMREAENKLIEQGVMVEEDRYKWPSNKLILLSSPSYTFEYMYEVYCLYRDRILGVHHEVHHDDADLADQSDYSIIVQLAYDMAPPDLYDKKQLSQHKQTMSEAVFAKEYGGQFISESDSYFKLSKMMQCIIPDGEQPTTRIVGDQDKKYSFAIDPSWSQDSASDDFAITGFELNEETQKDAVVHAYGIAGQPTKNHIQYLLYLLKNFNTEFLALDYAGGLQFVQTCNESELFKEAGIELFIVNDEMESDFMKPEKYNDDLRCFKKQLQRRTDKKIPCYLRNFSSTWIREANEYLQAQIDHKRIYFGSAGASVESSFEEQTKANIGVRKLKYTIYQNEDRETTKFLNEGMNKMTSVSNKMVEFLDHQTFMLELTRQEAANVEIKTSPQGNQTFQLPQHMQRQTGPNRPRKDNYSTLVLGNWANRMYHEAIAAEDKKVAAATFTPMAF